jgi:hypothetical protein
MTAEAIGVDVALEFLDPILGRPAVVLSPYVRNAAPLGPARKRRHSAESAAENLTKWY